MDQRNREKESESKECRTESERCALGMFERLKKEDNPVRGRTLGYS